MFLKINLLVFLMTQFLSLHIHASELYQQGQNARYLGMGGTSVAIARGVDALFLNPAALSKTEGFSFNLANVSLGISKNAQGLYDKLSTSSGSSLSLTDINSFYGENYFTDITTYGGIAIPYFAVGAYSYNTALQSFSNPALAEYNINLVSDYGYAVGGAFSLTKEISFGISGRSVKRWSGQKTISAISLVGSNTQNVIETNLPDKGNGNALDLGLLASFQNSGWTTNYAFAWHDVGCTKFSTSAGTGPERQEDNLIFGAAAQKELGILTWTNALEYKFIRNAGDISKKIHLGSELSVGLFDLRAGFYQGYLSYGATLDFAFIKIDAAAYTGELGTSAGQSSNPRYEASISLNLDLDQSFKIQASDGKRRRLNLRR